MTNDEHKPYFTVTEADRREERNSSRIATQGLTKLLRRMLTDCSISDLR